MSGRLHVFAIDPGQRSGWRWLSVPIEELISQGFTRCAQDRLVVATHGVIDCHDEIAGVTGLVDLWRIVWETVDEDDLLCMAVEDFLLRESTPDRALLSPVRITAALRDRLRAVRFPLWLWLPVDGMRIVTDERLKAWALYTPGEDHPRDATRGAVLTARKFSAEPNFRDWIEKRQP